jgi:hypothetical protein
VLNNFIGLIVMPENDNLLAEFFAPLRYRLRKQVRWHLRVHIRQ